ncbi:hypothetical protein AU196_15030 [Mycobacterium sp. IS-1742]|uniref:hypothetical protein n=1 Tax=Mycobacterium sp. IS-1742 TaxID=1772285 RepID=UPI00074043AB|nr:hypothetical protein [Mycobacterium sp. IS-1742]KUI24836.1 hypothetical protein AU196_15030 [Mycobacterium sp. IS-1742]
MAPGLSDEEVSHVESTFGFAFADDHRDFLAAGLPIGEGWPDWRAEGHRTLERQLQLPVDGVLFAVEWKQFWDDGWGERPARMKHALRSAAYQLARVPRLVPVHSNCYLPAGPGSRGHPVLSIYQADIRVAAANLLDYVTRLAAPGGCATTPAAQPTVAFWSDHVR